MENLVFCFAPLSNWAMREDERKRQKSSLLCPRQIYFTCCSVQPNLPLRFFLLIVTLNKKKGHQIPSSSAHALSQMKQSKLGTFTAFLFWFVGYLLLFFFFFPHSIFTLCLFNISHPLMRFEGSQSVQQNLQCRTLCNSCEVRMWLFPCSANWQPKPVGKLQLVHF